MRQLQLRAKLIRDCWVPGEGIILQKQAGNNHRVVVYVAEALEHTGRGRFLLHEQSAFGNRYPSPQELSIDLVEHLVILNARIDDGMQRHGTRRSGGHQSPLTFLLSTSVRLSQSGRSAGVLGGGPLPPVMLPHRPLPV